MTCRTRWIFFDHEAIAEVSALRRSGRLEEAEARLSKAEPSAAVLDEFRKIATSRARDSRKRGDWRAVVRYLEGYEELARRHHDHCLSMVNAEPPPHTDRDKQTLEQARKTLGL